MKNYTKKYLKASNGITLIALVITIIVLLILAGISISMLSGDNGILQKATDAKNKSDEAQIKERLQLAELAARTYDNGNLLYSKLNEELTKEFGTKGTDWTISAENTNPWVVTVDGNEYPITPEVQEIESTISFTIISTTDCPWGKSYNVPLGTTFKQWIVDFSPEGINCNTSINSSLISASGFNCTLHGPIGDASREIVSSDYIEDGAEYGFYWSD